jgi:hypothetical protein
VEMKSANSEMKKIPTPTTTFGERKLAMASGAAMKLPMAQMRGCR